MSQRPPADTPAAELRGVTKVYEGGVVAVDDVSLTVDQGEFFSLLGPSGCGKSTTLRLIAGLERASAGEVRIHGEPMGDRPAHRRPTNLVFQHLALFPHLDVGENVAFGPRIRRLPKGEIEQRVSDALELVGLPRHRKRRITQLSGGEQQRVAIARALVNRPAVLLLDEPLGALDLRLRLHLQDALKAIQRRSSTTFIYVTHDQGEALTMSDRIAIMREGRIEQVGTPTEIYERPRTPFAATFVGDTNLIQGRYRDHRLEAGDVAVWVGGPGSAVSVRPERLQVAERLPTAVPNRFQARIEEVVYLGARLRYRLRLETGRTLLAERQNEPACARLQVGDRVEVGWTVEDGTVLQETG
jgi:spermidine/putrescine transport system ATP-binding protein